MNNSSSVKNNWMTNEMNKAYPSYTTSNKTRLPLADIEANTEVLPGWFRGSSKVIEKSGNQSAKDIIPSSNVVGSNIYFSFTLLNHPVASYTLVPSWVDVNGNNWVPNSKGQYLHMKHTPEKAPYASPTFDDFDKSDQVQLLEVRDYTYKVKTPISNTILEAKVRMNDYLRNTPLVDRVPSALKRKYIEFTGMYADENFTKSRATFADVFENDEPEKSKNRDIWLKYQTKDLPFEAATTATTYKNLKWYNIFANKQENLYVMWYDTEGGRDQFSTKNGGVARSKYTHESHFAFVGDPYELYVVSRKASDDVIANPDNVKKK